MGYRLIKCSTVPNVVTREYVGPDADPLGGARKGVGAEEGYEYGDMAHTSTLNLHNRIVLFERRNHPPHRWHYPQEAQEECHTVPR